MTVEDEERGPFAPCSSRPHDRLSPPAALAPAGAGAHHLCRADALSARADAGALAVRHRLWLRERQIRRAGEFPRALGQPLLPPGGDEHGAVHRGRDRARGRGGPRPRAAARPGLSRPHAGDDAAARAVRALDHGRHRDLAGLVPFRSGLSQQPAACGRPARCALAVRPRSRALVDRAGRSVADGALRLPDHLRRAAADPAGCLRGGPRRRRRPLAPLPRHDAALARTLSLRRGAAALGRQLQAVRQGLRHDRRRAGPGDRDGLDVRLPAGLPLLRHRAGFGRRGRDDRGRGRARGSLRRRAAQGAGR